MSEKKYYCFTEENDWEGETWSFYIPEFGNEKAIQELKKFIKDKDQYTISDKLFTKTEVMVLCENADGCYMPDHNILKGKLTLPDSYDDDDPFYKGDIKKFVKK